MLAEGVDVFVLRTSATNGNISVWGPRIVVERLGFEPRVSRSHRLKAFAVWREFALGEGVRI